MLIQEVRQVEIPHMEVVDKLWQFPAVESAWNTSSSLYGRVKGYNSLLNWTFTSAEGAMLLAFEQVAPVVKKFEQPIHMVDTTLCKGLDKLEEKVPFVKEPPQQVYEKAKSYASATIQPAVHTACNVVQGTLQQTKKINVRSLKDLSWSKANEILSSQYGHLALTGLDSTAGVADRCLDYYLPAGEETEDEDTPHVHPNSQCDDKVMHTIHTVGILSNKVAQRVYHSVSYHISQINKQNINEYLRSLALVVQLTSFLDTINRQVEQRFPSRQSESVPPNNSN